MLKTPRILSFLLIVLVLALTAFTVFSITSEARMALKQSSQDQLMDVAEAVATQIDGDSFETIRPGDESSAGFIALRDELHRVRAGSADIHFIYTMRREGPGVVFVVDGDYGYAGDAATIGQPYPQAEPELFAGFNGPSADSEFTTDRWGTVLSGFAPIRDRSGAVVGIVGIDMDSGDVTASINRLNLIIAFAGLIAAFFAALGLFVVEHRRAFNERTIEESERKYRTLFERAGDAIFLIETDGESLGKIVESNMSAAVMHGYLPEELPGLSLNQLNVKSLAFSDPDKIRQTLSSGWLQGERLHRRKDGSTFPVEFSATALVIGGKTYILVIDRDISERKKAVDAIQKTTNKLNLLNSVTFNDIQNAVYSIDGYLELDREACGEAAPGYREKEKDLIRKIRRTLNFARSYQDLGTTPPTWQSVGQVFLFAISHIDLTSVKRTVDVEGLEIYADSLLERAFQALAHNVITKGKTATKISLTWKESPAGLTMIFEDNGVGIPEKLKESVFQRGFGTQKAMELFLVREILGITGITIRETGTPGSGARFEILVPPNGYRFPR
jgi:PAS domain S-box-containing protein